MLLNIFYISISGKVEIKDRVKISVESMNKNKIFQQKLRKGLSKEWKSLKQNQMPEIKKKGSDDISTMTISVIIHCYNNLIISTFGELERNIDR